MTIDKNERGYVGSYTKATKNPHSKMKQKHWYNGLELLRVCFCFVVLIHHYMMVFIPNSWQLFFNDGNFAVFFFLLLSGYLIGGKAGPVIPTFRNKLTLCLDYGIKRYIRLIPVVVISVSVASLIYFAGGYYTVKLSNSLDLNTAGRYYSFSDYHWFNALFDAFFGSFIRRPEINTPLWTIKYEFIVVIIAYIVTVIVKDGYIFPSFVILGIIFFLFEPYISAVFIGAAIGCIPLGYSKRINRVVLLLGAIMLYVATYFGRFVVYLRLLSCCCLFLSLKDWDYKPRRVGKIILQLSKLTFAIYAIHWPIICSFSSGFILLLCHRIMTKPYESEYLIIVLSVLIITIILVLVASKLSKIEMFIKKIPYKR